MRHNMEVPDGTVGHLKPMLQIKILPGACCQIDRLPNPCSVVRMHSLEYALDGGMDLRIVSGDPEGFLGPGEFTARDVPAETAGAAQLLRLGQIGCLTSSKHLFGPFARYDVIAGLERRFRLPALIALQGPAALDHPLRAIPLCVDEFALPAIGAHQSVCDLIKRHGKTGTQQAVDDLADRLPSFPSVELLGAAIPVLDYPVHVANNYRVKSEIKKLDLFALNLCELAYMPDQCSNYQRRNQKGDETGEILVELYLEGKYRLYKEKIEARNGQNGEKDRCGKAVHQGKQHDNNQIGGLGCDLVEPELDARPAYESQENAAR